MKKRNCLRCYPRKKFEEFGIEKKVATVKLETVAAVVLHVSQQ